MAGRDDQKKFSDKAAVWSDPRDPRSAEHARRILIGMKAIEERDTETAKEQFRAVLAENMEHPDALFGMGMVARYMGQHLTGAELMRRAIAVSPNPVYWSNLGNLFQEMGDHDGALTAQKEAFRLNPKHPAIVQNYANALNHLDRFYEAMPLFRKLARTFPDRIEHQVNYATVLTRIGEYAAANKVFREAQRLEPAHATCNFHNGVNLMMTGDWEKAWRLYEWRFMAPAYIASVRRFTVAAELPEDLSGERVFIYGEQGIGDELRFAGMLNEALDRGGDVTLECNAKLVPLFERSFPDARVVTARYRPADQGEETFDRYIPVGSLGKFLRTRREDFPKTTGYLKPAPERAADWKRWLDGLDGQGPRVGICWRSSMAGHLRSTAYANVEDLEPLFRMKGITLVNLQYDDATAELNKAREAFGAKIHVPEGLDLFNDLDGAAALTSGLDYVVSANTSVTCMAGGIGVPGIEFRARPIHKNGAIDGNDPWYPSIGLIGKRAGEPWSGVFRTIARGVEKRFLAGGRG